MTTTDEKTTLYKLTEDIDKMLRDNDIYADVYPQLSVYNQRPGICVQIDWGDWKHEHLRANYLIEEHFGLTCTSEQTTEENGSDCYSALHFYPYPGLRHGHLVPDALLQEM